MQGHRRACCTNGNTAKGELETLGAEFIAFNCDLTEAINEFDERFGERCEPTDAALADYLTESEASQKVDAADAKTIAEARMHKAMDEGDVRMNDGGTCVWVDPSEWAKTFDDVRAAMRCFLGIRD